jgi:membrane protein
MRFRDIGSLLASAAAGWSADNALRLSAALAYYSVFSLAPLLVIAISVVGLVFGEAAARGDIADQMKQLAGDRAAEAIQMLVLGTRHKSASVSATVIGLVILLFGASGAFSELKDALNTIWGVAIKPGRPLVTIIRERFISFTMVLGVGFLLLVSLVLSATLTALGATMRNLLALPGAVWQSADILVSFAVVTMLFAMIFKFLPNVMLRLRDVWIGAGCTAFLFTLGKFLIGLYLGTSGVTSYYGAAGSVVVILLWVYYSACILFFGAEFTKAYASKYGSGVIPDKRAELRFRAPRGDVGVSSIST